MFSNFIKIAIRQMMRQQWFTAINILGLSLGLASCLLIGLWVLDEYQIDGCYTNSDRVYKVLLTNPTGERKTGEISPIPLADALKAEVPEIENACQMAYQMAILMNAGEQHHKMNLHLVSPEFLQILDFPLMHGNPATVLTTPHSIVISENMARKFFNTTDVVGKTIDVTDFGATEITGVMYNLPSNSTLKKAEAFMAIEPYVKMVQSINHPWTNSIVHTFIRLRAGASEQVVAQKIQKFIEQKDSHASVDLHIQRFQDRYLYGKWENGQPVGGRISYVRLLSGLAVFLLFLACINFMNLSTAKATHRAKEIGIRKSMGSGRGALIGQFYGEALLMSLISAGVAVTAVLLLLPAFNELTGKDIAINWGNTQFWGLIAATILGTVLLAGSYPALFLSSFKPAEILKGKLDVSTGLPNVRKGLVVFQFGISILMLIGLLTARQQMDFIRNTNLGLDRSNILVHTLDGSIRNRFQPLRNDLLQVPGIQSVTTCQQLPINIDDSSGDLNWPGKDPKAPAMVKVMCVGDDFIKTMGITMVAGRDFGAPNDTLKYLINESCARMMGMKDPVGQKIKFWLGNQEILGVMKDFHLQSLHIEIEPLVLVYQPNETYFTLIKTAPGQMEQVMASFVTPWETHNPGFPVDFGFLDKSFERQYKSETLVHQLVSIFSLISIFIACLGLLGLATFTAEQRRKEIGIRKVLGASVVSVVALLSSDFLKLVFIALILASPVAWWAMNHWLSDFAYHIDLQWWMFGVVGTLALLIAFFTVGGQAVKAALANPVKSLRSE
jgi:putative ABC transport system permease protein